VEIKDDQPLYFSNNVHTSEMIESCNEKHDNFSEDLCVRLFGGQCQRIAILGATSQIAKDLTLLFAAQNTHELVLFARRPEVVAQWLANAGLTGRYEVADFSAFNMDAHFDAIINFVGVGDPLKAKSLGAAIVYVTLQFDELALSYVRKHPSCRYIFLSSGAAYGASFDAPVDANTKAVIDINHLQQQDWYSVAKLHAECRHRTLAHLSIVDIRIFNYFSHTQDMEARFLITDITRAIRNKDVLKTSTDSIIRDFISPDDFHNLVNAILTSKASNAVVDCYTKAPIDKATLLATLQAQFGLQYEFVQSLDAVNATGIKPHYYSLNRRAGDFGYEPNGTSLENILHELKAGGFEHKAQDNTKK
jgi:nucleoside-diphosphate-sugar epimerase